ncbi:hypothetical protein [Actinotalea solisilvae]|uniref:hypothetical protein n=1 Tax=Actinotalea solisilvae TaxID=2072922 RepID=UPI0018F1CBD5|nr:hypothetical protein [Actinotalea solisilvae]
MDVRRRTIGNAARGLAAAAVLLSAVVHLDLWALGLSAHPVLGPGFLATFVGGVVVALALLLWDHWLPPLAAVGFGLATLGAYVMALTVGFLGVQEAGGGTPATLSLVSESAAVVLGVVVLAAERGLRRRTGTSPARDERIGGLTPPRPARP